MRLKKQITCPVCGKELANLRDGTLEIAYASKAKGIAGEIRAVHATCAGVKPSAENFPLARLEDNSPAVGLHLLKLIDEFYLTQRVADAFWNSIYDDFQAGRFWDEVRGRKKDDKERW